MNLKIQSSGNVGGLNAGNKQNDVKIKATQSQSDKADSEAQNNQTTLKAVGKKLDEFQKISKVSFQYDIKSNPDMIIIKIIDPDNGETISQIPPEAAVKLSKAIDELLGIFVDKHA